MLTVQQQDKLKQMSTGLVWEWNSSAEDDEILRFLLSEGLIAPREDIAPDFLLITEHGKAGLYDLEQIAAKHTEDKRQQRFQNKISVLTALVPLITFILGLLFDHFLDVVDVIISLFH